MRQFRHRVPVQISRWPARLALIALIAVALPAAAAALPDATTFALRVEQGDIGTVAEWLDAGLDPNFEGDRVGSGLMIAAWEGNIPMMELLVKRGADVNHSNGFNEQALMHAAWKGHMDAVVWLLEHGARVNREGKEWSALHYAAFGGHDAIAKYLIEKGADVNARSTNGSTVLMMAAREGREKIARMLLEAGADRGVKNDREEDALVWAMRYQHLAIAKLISVPDEFAQAAVKPKESWGEAVSPVPVPPEVEKIVQDNRVERAKGRERTLSADEYRKILDRVAKKPAPTRRQPKGMSITARKSDPRKEKAELMYSK